MGIYDREKMLERVKSSRTNSTVLLAILQEYTDDDEILIALSSNVNINDYIAKNLATISNRRLKANNSSGTIEGEENVGYTIQKNLIKNPVVSDDILKYIALNTPEKRVLRLILNNCIAKDETKQIVKQIIYKPLEESKRKALIYVDNFRGEVYKNVLYHIDLFLEDINILIDEGIDKKNKIILDCKKDIIYMYIDFKILSKEVLQEFISKLIKVKKERNRRYYDILIDEKLYKDLYSILSSYSEFLEIRKLAFMAKNINDFQERIK